MRGKIISTIAIATVAAGMGVAQASPGSDTARHGEAFEVTRAVQGILVEGHVTDAYGDPMDNVRIAAYADGQGTPASSAITYGGDFALHVPRGTYRLEFTDPSGVHAPLSIEGVKIRDYTYLDQTRMLMPAPQNRKAPRIKGDVEAGAILKADPGSWEEREFDLNYSYEWTVGDKVVSKKGSFQVPVKMLGSRVRLTVVASAKGILPGTAHTDGQSIGKATPKIEVGKVKAKKGKGTLSVDIRATAPLSGELLVRGESDGRLLGKVVLRGEEWDGNVSLTGVRTDRITVSYKGNQAVKPASVTVPGLKG